MIIKFKHKGSFKKTEKFFKNVESQKFNLKLRELGEKGVAALKAATPKDTGKTSESWRYEIRSNRYGSSIVWINNNTINYVNIAVILQYGHATKNGHWIEGIDYINPAMKPIFEQIANDAWEEVVKK